MQGALPNTQPFLYYEERALVKDGGVGRGEGNKQWSMVCLLLFDIQLRYMVYCGAF